MLALPATSSGEWRGNLDAHTGEDPLPAMSSGEWRGNLDAHTHRRPSKVRGAMLALPTMLRRGQHAHR